MKNIKGQDGNLTLVLGGTGKIGRRVAKRLINLNHSVRIGSRSATPPFDWENQSTWAPAMQNVHSIFLTYYPDFAVPGAVDAIRTFTDLAVQLDVHRLVMLSGRGEDEAQKCEQVVQNSGILWTILRSSWFSQNFSEGFFRDLVLSGQVALPAGTVGEPFVDAEDIADVAVAALTEYRHIEQVYELTGPRLLTFARAVEEIAEVTGRNIEYTPITNQAFSAALKAQDVPGDTVALMSYLFATVLDGRNAHLTDGVQRALGRQPRDFSDFLREAVASGAWQEKESAMVEMKERI